MTAKFNEVLDDLRDLESRLKAAANRLWAIKLSLASALEKGHAEADFLPRRLGNLEREEQQVFERLLNRLNRLISERLDSSLIAFSSMEDVATVASISRTIRSLHNAFAGELSLGPTWARLNAALPAFSKN